ARDLRVFIAIGAHADGSTGRAWPSMTRIAKMTGILRGDIPRSIHRLEDAGLLSAERHPGASTVYSIVFADEGSVSADLPTPATVSGSTDGVSADLLTGCQRIHRRT